MAVTVLQSAVATQEQPVQDPNMIFHLGINRNYLRGFIPWKLKKKRFFTFDSL